VEHLPRVLLERLFAGGAQEPDGDLDIVLHAHAECLASELIVCRSVITPFGSLMKSVGRESCEADGGGAGC
jgi:hypothetical protein